jgi:hypothetical protein
VAIRVYKDFLVWQEAAALYLPLINRLFGIRLLRPRTWNDEAALRERTDCTSTNGLVAP